MPTDPPNNAPNSPLHSTLASDPDMAELVQFFVQEMGERVASIDQAARGNDLSQLRTVAHQLKGSAGGYGFSPISDCAASLEQLIDASEPAADPESLREQVDALIDLCRRAAM